MMQGKSIVRLYENYRSMKVDDIGIAGVGIYLPEKRMSAAEIAKATKGVWTEENVINKLGIVEKRLAGKEDGTQEMGVKAGLNALENSNVNPEDIDLILCIGEEWKEYPLTTSGIYIQEKIGARNAWAIDLQQRCCTAISAMKIAKDMMLADDDINTCMIVGGYRNGDFVNYLDKSMSMMFNLSAAGGALILKSRQSENLVLGSHIMSDGSMARDAGVIYGGTENPVTCENAGIAYKSLTLMNEEHMKQRLNEVSMDNWLNCIDSALKKSGISRNDIGFLATLHFKRSMYRVMLEELGLTPEQSIYLENYGHAGQIDQILALHLALQNGKLKKGDYIVMIAAGIGYAWAANVIRWG